MPHKYFYRRTDIKEEHCGIQFEYIWDSDDAAMDKLLSKIGFLSCDYLRRIGFYSNDNESGDGDFEDQLVIPLTSFRLKPSHVDIGHVILGGMIVILIAITAFCSCRGRKTEKVANHARF